uniref:Uncharacterized protein n=1 Tax=Anguilla anguilla TaxID=7936 RepID=A0A0E9QHA1_ANGAN
MQIICKSQTHSQITPILKPFVISYMCPFILPPPLGTSDSVS